MSLQTNQKGFTIVELLIVIVVIAILAAISIVAYTGIQNRAKASSSQSIAAQVAKKAAAFYTVSTNSQYPANAAGFGTAEGSLEGLSLIDRSGTNEQTVANYNDGKTGIYRLIGATTGGCVYWWDYTKTANQWTPVYFGTTTSGC